MNALSLRLLTVLGLTTALLGCTGEKEELKVETAADYVALAPGKYIIYHLDSTVFTQAGRKEETHAYQEKHLVDAQLTDNLGRPSYRVFRYIRNEAGTSNWVASGAYLVTPTQNALEVIEDNKRVVKLIAPVKEGITWQGNRYLGSEPYSAQFNFNNDDNMADWKFEISSVGQTATFGGKEVADVITLEQQDETINNPATDPNTYATRTLSTEKYAKGIGMVYQEYVMWEYQPPTGQGTTGYKVGFGVKRSMIDHN